MMNFKRIPLAALQVIGFGLMPASALAQITDTTTFTGQVPGTCSYSSGTSQTIEMSYSPENNGTFTGQTQNLTISCNFATSVTLGAVNENLSNPTETNNTASLFVGGSGDALVTSGVSASEETSLGNSPGVATNVQIGLEVQGASAVGDYSYTVVLTTLSS